MPKHFITESKKKSIVSKYRKGIGMRKIATDIGCAPETVRRILNNDPTVTVRKRGKSSVNPVGKSKVPMPPASNGPSIGSSDPIPRKKAFKRKKTGPGLENACKSWTPDEDSVLMEAVHSGMELGEAASLLGRTKVAVSGRKSYLIKRSDEAGRRFPRPDGITYGRTEVLDSMNTPLDTPSRGEEEMYDSPMTRVNISDIAQVVRDYGVSAQISITPEGTKIDIKA